MAIKSAHAIFIEMRRRPKSPTYAILRQKYIYYFCGSKLKFSSGELEDRGESATSECNSDSDFEREENQHIKSRILPTVLEIKNMVNEMREKQNERDTESLRSNFSNSTLSLNNLNQKVQESKRLSRNIQVLLSDWSTAFKQFLGCI